MAHLLCDGDEDKEIEMARIDLHPSYSGRGTTLSMECLKGGRGKGHRILELTKGGNEKWAPNVKSHRYIKNVAAIGSSQGIQRLLRHFSHIM